MPDLTLEQITRLIELVQAQSVSREWGDILSPLQVMEIVAKRERKAIEIKDGLDRLIPTPTDAPSPAAKPAARVWLYGKQERRCRLCAQELVMDEPKLNQRTGEPLKGQDRLAGYWLQQIIPHSVGGPSSLGNHMLVHPDCGTGYSGHWTNQKWTDWIDRWYAAGMPTTDKILEGMLSLAQPAPREGSYP